jgi:hypothetical protein
MCSPALAPRSSPLAGAQLHEDESRNVSASQTIQLKESARVHMGRSQAVVTRELTLDASAEIIGPSEFQRRRAFAVAREGNDEDKEEAAAAAEEAGVMVEEEEAVMVAAEEAAAEAAAEEVEVVGAVGGGRRFGRARARRLQSQPQSVSDDAIIDVRTLSIDPLSKVAGVNQLIVTESARVQGTIELLSGSLDFAAKSLQARPHAAVQCTPTPMKCTHAAIQCTPAPFSALTPPWLTQRTPSHAMACAPLMADRCD